MGGSLHEEFVFVTARIYIAKFYWVFAEGVFRFVVFVVVFSIIEVVKNICWIIIIF